MAYVFEQKLLPESKYKLKCPYSLTPIGICIHNTANSASADNEVKYHNTNNNATSYHIAVDDKKVIQCVPFNRNAFAAGDGGSGTGNRKYIHIEICYSKNGGQQYKDSEENAVQYIAKLLKQYGWTTKQVKKHQDFSGKYCPHRILDEGRWVSFLNRIDAAMKSGTVTPSVPEQKEESFVFTSPTLKEQFESRTRSKATAKLIDDAAVKELGYKSKLDKNGNLSNGDLAALATELAVKLIKK